jgi:hypothetical protein
MPRVSLCACVRACVYACMHVCMYTYTYTHTYMYMCGNTVSSKYNQNTVAYM